MSDTSGGTLAMINKLLLSGASIIYEIELI